MKELGFLCAGLASSNQRVRFSFQHECAHIVLNRWPGYRTCEALLGIEHRRHRRRRRKVEAPPETFNFDDFIKSVASEEGDQCP